MSAPIVQTAGAVIQTFGMTPTYTMSSTDSNIPMNMGIPAITLESGGTGSRNHTLEEWTDVEKTTSVKGIRIAMGILLAAQLRKPSVIALCLASGLVAFRRRLAR